MAKILSLGTARKAKLRADKKRQADENAAKFGRTPAQKAREKAHAQKLEDHLNQHQRDKNDG